MPYRFDFFTRPLNSDYKLHWESVLIELSLGVICAVMALYGWNTGIALMAYPAAVLAFVCFGMVAYSLSSFVWYKIKSK